MILAVLHFLEESELIEKYLEKSNPGNLMTELSVIWYLLRSIRSAAIISDVCCCCYSTNYDRDPSTDKVEPKK